MWPALRRWLTRPGIVPVLAFVLLYRVGDRAMAAMTQPFWVNIGLADDEIGFIGMILGLPVGIISAFIGARVVTRLGIARALWILGALALLSNLAYAVAALPGMGRGAVYGAAIVESLCGWLQGIGFMSYLMRICEKEHAAVQYALLTALYALTGSLVSMPSGWFVDHIGYAAYFTLTAAFALPAFFFLPAANRWIDGDD
jgi:PAT family beta-lactamase induction signal transducer AmpG